MSKFQNGRLYFLSIAKNAVLTIEEEEFQLLVKYLNKLLFRGESSGDVKISKWPTLLPVLSEKDSFDH